MHQPSGEQMPIYDAAMRYKREGVPLVVFGGKEYGTGSSRDWAAKGTFLLGVKAVIAESFERIHRSNLVGMGVLPLTFTEGQDRKSLGITGEEVIDILGLEELRARMTLEMVIHRPDGREDRAQASVPRRYGRRGRVLQERRHPALRAARDGQGGVAAAHRRAAKGVSATEPSRARAVAPARSTGRSLRMNILKPACAVAALFALAACDQPRSRMSSPGTGTPGAPTAPSASMPTGSSPSPATGGGVPTPTSRGGAGGVGSGTQPGVGGTGGGSGR